MTTDPSLESLFSASERTFEDNNFTQEVMSKSRFTRHRNLILGLLALIITVITVTVLSNNVQALIIQFNQVLTTDIIDLGEGMTAVIVSPINSIAGILFIAAKISHLIYKWVNK